MSNLYQKASHREKRAMLALYEQYGPTAYYICRHLLQSEEAAATLLPRIFKELWRQLSKRPAQTETEFRRALLNLVARQCSGITLAKNPRAFQTHQGTPPVKAKVDDGLSLIQLLEAALARLTPVERYVYLLEGVGGMEDSNCAQILKFKQWMRAARRDSAELYLCAQLDEDAAAAKNDETRQKVRTLLTDAARGAEVPAEANARIRADIDSFGTDPSWQKLAALPIAKITAVVVAVCLVLVIAIAGVFMVNTSGSGEDAASEATTETSTEETAAEAEEPEATAAATPETSAEETMYADIDIADYGTVTVQLDPDAAPETVANFVSLAEDGFYDGLTFHRIIDGFMMQGGDPNGDGTGGSDTTIPGEFSDNGFENDLSHTRGAVSMARSSDYDSASSQFFIVQQDSTYLDGSYAVFGYVTDGMDIVDEICESAQPTDDNGTISADQQPVINSITIRTETA